MCAGSGLWSRLLSAGGVAITATDAHPGREGDYFPTETLDAQHAVQQHSEYSGLLLCWPPFRDPCAHRALAAFRGDCVVFVGDPRFTADREFHDLLAQDWTLHQRIPLPTWPGVTDAAYLFERKET